MRQTDSGIFGMNIYSLPLGCESPLQNRNLCFGITVPQHPESARFGGRDGMLSSHGSWASAAHSHRAATQSVLKEKKSHWEALQYFFQDSSPCYQCPQAHGSWVSFPEGFLEWGNLTNFREKSTFVKVLMCFKGNSSWLCLKFIRNVLLIPPRAPGKDSSALGLFTLRCLQ